MKYTCDDELLIIQRRKIANYCQAILKTLLPKNYAAFERIDSRCKIFLM